MPRISASFAWVIPNSAMRILMTSPRHDLPMEDGFEPHI